MNRIFTILIILVTWTFAESTDPGTNPLRTLEFEQWDGNQVSSWFGNNGHLVSHIPTGASGLEWPKSSGKTAVFASGLWVISGSTNGEVDIRSAAVEFTSEFQPGIFESSPNEAEYRLYHIRAGDNASTPDWIDWPVDQGAPWIDIDEDTMYNPDIDEPDVLGDQFSWYVMNDGDQNTHSQLWSTQPLGIEVRTSHFGWDADTILTNVMFFNWAITNAGNNELDSVYASVWCDPDLGDASDDYIGCDPALHLGYCYNDFGGDQTYGAAPPAMGCVLLQGPIVQSPGDTAWVSGDPVPDYRNLDMTAFSVYINGDTLLSDPETAGEAYNYMNGLMANGNPYVDPASGTTSRFVMSGDPVSGEGWVDHVYGNSGDRRFLLSCGPFSLAAGASQEMIGALLLAQGEDNLSSITELRTLTNSVTSFWELLQQGIFTDIATSTLPVSYVLNQNYPNPFNPITTIEYSLPEASSVNLTIFNIRGQEIMTLQEALKAPGKYDVQWNGMDQSENPVNTGVYFARLEAGEYTKTIKMLYLK
ncbi:MAG: T9SS type A sorting domain-containing protein [FCB group bacterium]|nr:T9SS type A sorting domain-containing protein [FCB group bacterium]